MEGQHKKDNTIKKAKGGIIIIIIKIIM